MRLRKRYNNERVLSDKEKELYICDKKGTHRDKIKDERKENKKMKWESIISGKKVRKRGKFS